MNHSHRNLLHNSRATMKEKNLEYHWNFKWTIHFEFIADLIAINYFVFCQKDCFCISFFFRLSSPSTRVSRFYSFSIKQFLTFHVLVHRRQRSAPGKRGTLHVAVTLYTRAQYCILFGETETVFIPHKMVPYLDVFMRCYQLPDYIRWCKKLCSIIHTLYLAQLFAPVHLISCKITYLYDRFSLH